MSLFTKLFGNDNEKQLKKIYVIADKVEALADKYSAMTDKELNAQTAVLKKRLIAGETLDEILPDAYACVREASERVLGMRHFYVQIVGGIVLHQGRIAEMSTGEGKTLVATLPAYLNALTEKGVHVVTVNEYLAKRDADWMGKVYRFLGLTVGVIYSGQNPAEKQAAYNCDITYGTNSEFGFDYLRDSQIRSERMLSQRGLNFVIIDEVDSVLIDEARTPLIISAPRQSQAEGFYKANAFAKTLKAPDPEADNEEDKEGDFEINEEDKKIALTERGMHKAESYFKVDNIGSFANIELYRNIRLAVRANYLMQRDRDYVVKDGEIIIVDEFTGRLMVGRRFNDGLHSAIEVKEGVRIKRENSVVATITYQNLFRLYKKLCGMTGTAKTEEDEFREIYGLDIVVVPTNKPIARIDEVDRLYTTLDGKYNAIIEDIKECQSRKQPVLVGTVSVEKSEILAGLLRKERIQFELLNAKNHEFEATIVAQAGRLGAVTIATNMAGRGTDIMLGGNPEFLAKQYLERAKYPEKVISEAISKSKDVSAQAMKAREIYLQKLAEYKEQVAIEKQEVIEAGGLRIIGTERHESRRIDNQLRGRSGRQGDRGSSVFYLSMEDDLIRIFGGDRLKNMAQSLHLPDDLPISVKMIAKRVEDAQQRIESRNYSIRKQVLTYDDVMNRQRKIIYADRYRMLLDKSKYIETMDMLSESVENVLSSGGLVDADYRKIDFAAANRGLTKTFLLKGDAEDYLGAEFITEEEMSKFDSTEIREKIKKRIKGFYNEKIYAAEIVCEKENFAQAISLSIDLTKDYNEWNYDKLNELLTVKIKKEVGDFAPFTVKDAKTLSEFTADAIAEKVSENFKSFFNKKIADLYSGAICSMRAYDLNADGLNDASKAEAAVAAAFAIDAIREKEDTEEITSKLVSLLSEGFAKTFAGDGLKAERSLLAKLRCVNKKGEVILSGVMSTPSVNLYALKIFVELVSSRLAEAYGSAEAFEKYVENYSGGDIKTYLANLIMNRSDKEKPFAEWDFNRINEYLSYHCLNKRLQEKGGKFLTVEDVEKVDKAGVIQNAVKMVVTHYSDLIKKMREGVKYEKVFGFLCGIEEGVEDVSALARDTFLSAYSVECEDLAVNRALSLSAQAAQLKKKLDLAIDKWVISLNGYIFSNVFNTLTDAYGKDAAIEKLGLGSLAPNADIKEAAEAYQTVALTPDVDKLAAAVANEGKARYESVYNGKTFLFETDENVAIKAEKALRIARSRAEIAEKFAKENVFESKNGRNELFEGVNKFVDKLFANYSDADYPDWKVGEISAKISEYVLPTAERSKGRNLLSRGDVRESVAGGVVGYVTPRVEKIYAELIERDKKENNVTPHEYILRMLPDVVAGYVMDYVDYAVDLETWNYSYINESLAEKLLPDGVDDEYADALVTKEVARKNNIDDVIDAVIEKVVAAYDRKAVDYNVSLIADYIDECVRLCVNNKVPFTEWNYDEINDYLGKRLLLPKDVGNKKLLTLNSLTENEVEEEEDEEENDSLEAFYEDVEYKKGARLGYKQITDVVIENYSNIVKENVQSYDRFISILCYRKGRRGLTFGFFEKDEMLNYTDERWRDHMDNMDRLREGIGLRAYGQQDPVLSYQKEGNELFDEMVDLVRDDVVLHALKDDPAAHFGQKQESVLDRKRNAKSGSRTFYKHSSDKTVRKIKEPRPNDRCPCGSGKKYKNCCMYKKDSVYNWKAIESEEE